MQTKTFDEFCPSCNIVVETKVISEASVHPEYMHENMQFYCDVYYLTKCLRCEHPFLIQEKYFVVPGDIEQLVETTKLYPQNKNKIIQGLPKNIQLSYEQAVQSFKVSLYEPCVLMCRKTLEIICKLHNINGKNLFHKLEKLKDQGLIDSKLLNWSHEIRNIGNDAAHDVDLIITKEDAEDTLELTEAILLYVYSFNEKFENFKKRRAQ